MVAPTAEEARALALPNLHAMVALRTGQPLRAQPLVEEAEAAPLAPQHEALAQEMLGRWVVGAPEEAARTIARLADTFGVEEVMVHPVAGATAGTPADRAPAREETLRLLAEALR
ncbi:hypothetical protein [Phycicoccus endophyticus]|uniref:hypothetical protein n=1 Tax=Phycicoccus endophyticus TaxID=1690220 RepID=UPI0030B82701